MDVKVNKENSGKMVLIDGREIRIESLSNDKLWSVYSRLEEDSTYDDISRKILDEIHFRERIEAYERDV